MAAFDQPESAERHLDFFGRPPRVGEAWRDGSFAGIASLEARTREEMAAVAVPSAAMLL